LEESVQPGSKKFIVLLQVPKNKKQITIQMQASGKTKSFLFVQGNLVSTAPKLFDIVLKK